MSTVEQGTDGSAAGRVRPQWVKAYTLQAVAFGPLAAWVALAAPAGHRLLAIPAAAALSAYILSAFADALRSEDETVVASATQPAFVVMLFTLPLNLVPLAVFAAELPWLGLRMPWRPERGAFLRSYRSRSSFAYLEITASSAFYSLTPTILLVALAPGPAAWREWPAYVLVFSGQFVIDTLFGVLRHPSLRRTVTSWMVGPAADALLTPVGVAAAVPAPYAPVRRSCCSQRCSG